MMPSTSPSSSSYVGNDLSGLELKCLDLVSKGVSLSKAAESLHLTERELEVLLYYVRRRLGATSTMQAVAICLANDVLPLPASNDKNR